MTTSDQDRAIDSLLATCDSVQCTPLDSGAWRVFLVDEGTPSSGRGNTGDGRGRAQFARGSVVVREDGTVEA